MSRYHLQKYAGISSRHTCPACERPRCFTLYIDDNGNILHPTVGRCDHESSCGYHRTPRQHFHDHPEHRHFVIPSERSESKNLLHYRHARPDRAILVLGVSFSLVPASMWPSVPKIIDEKILGSAYCLIFWVQNIGLCLVPMLIGTLRVSTDGYVVPMIVFASFGVLAFLLSLALKVEDKKKGYGLELPNKK